MERWKLIWEISTSSPARVQCSLGHSRWAGGALRFRSGRVGGIRVLESGFGQSKWGVRKLFLTLIEPEHWSGSQGGHSKLSSSPSSTLAVWL